MLDSDGGIMNLKAFRVGYIYRASLGLSNSHSTGKSAGTSSSVAVSDSHGSGAVEADMIFARPFVLIRLAQFLQKIQV